MLVLTRNLSKNITQFQPAHSRHYIFNQSISGYLIKSAPCCPIHWSLHPFYQWFMSPQSKSRKELCYFFASNYELIKSQFCTCHVMTCAKLWPDWVITIINETKIISIIFQLWDYKLFVQWVPGANQDWTKLYYYACFRPLSLKTDRN